jgi:ADP-ribosylglycohydrolase
MSPIRDQIAGALFGMAFGDALGRETEFLDFEGIRRRFPPSGPVEPDGDPILVTDDTQMAVVVGEALMETPLPYAPQALADNLHKRLIDWYNDVENHRAPGNTCLESIEHLMEGQHWMDATDISSKGSGANMRVQTVGLLNIDQGQRAKLAQFQAAMTHAHPTGMVAADLTAFVIADLVAGFSPFDLPRRIRQYAEDQRRVYHKDWLGDLWLRAYMMRTPEEYIEHGWSECIAILDKLDHALVERNEDGDPCEITGKGWIAEEAFATGLLCFLLFPDDPVRAIRRAAFSSGDSDTIACITGAFAGAYHGMMRWPEDWVRRIEYRDRLDKLADFFTAR